MLEKTDIEKAKKLEVEMLKYIREICVKDNINYYIIAGTLLGAIRHKGFIPWDDDIDIGLFRNDYDRLINALVKDCNSKYFLQNYITDKNFPRCYSKLRYNNTKFIEKNVSKLDIHHGVFVDIFPLDYIPAEKIKSMKFKIFMSKKFLGLISISRGVDHSKSWLKSKIKKILSLIISERMSNRMFKYVNNTFSKYKDSGHSSKLLYVTNFFSIYGWRKELIPANNFGEGIFLEFEGEKFKAPYFYHKILTQIYSNYLEYPPIEKRNSGHVLECIEVDAEYEKLFNK